MALLIGICAAQALPAELPARLVVLPAGDTVRGRDGRAWRAPQDLAQLLTELNAAGPVLLDENHASVHAAPVGGSSPAMGWLSDFQLTPSGLDAAVEWTPIGSELFSKKAYRYLSPALRYDTVGASPTVLGTIRGLHSVGLTNHPNLDLPALNAEEPQTNMTPEQIAALQAALVSAITEALKAPKPEVKEIVAPAPNAAEVEALTIAVNTVVDAAVAAGKIAPASKDKFVAMAGNSTGGLKQLQDVIATLPVLVATNAQNLSKSTPAAEGPKPLSATELKVIKAMGVSEEKFRATKGELG